MPPTRHHLSTCAITISTHQQHRHFQVTAHAELFVKTLSHYRDQGHFLLHAFVVMPDHVHVLITPAINVSTAKAIQFIKGGYLRAVRELTSADVWNKGYSEHRVRDLSDFHSQRNYIANNPGTRQHQNHPHVHPSHPHLLDPDPALRADPKGLSPVPRDDERDPTLKRWATWNRLATVDPAPSPPAIPAPNIHNSASNPQRLIL